jgi:large subunit ribosomal protein L24
VSNKVKIKKDDNIEVITGKRDDRGKRGQVLRVFPKTNRVVIQGINMRKKHQRQVQAEGRNLDVGIVEFEGQMSLSNVMLVCPKCDEPSRVGFTRDEDGQVHRVCKSCDEEID